MRTRPIHLTEGQREELLNTRKHHPLPYMRTKAAAILKVACGQQIKNVAATELNEPHCEESVSQWITRYEQQGLDGLLVKKGRGRKPAFFP